MSGQKKTVLSVPNDLIVSFNISDCLQNINKISFSFIRSTLILTAIITQFGFYIKISFIRKFYDKTVLYRFLILYFADNQFFIKN